MSKRKFKLRSLNELRAKLSFDEGFAERPIYVIKGFTSEKDKGVDMIHLIKQNFNISDEFIRRKLMQLNSEAMRVTKYPSGLTPPPKLTRDEKGNLVSPFRSKKKLV